MKSKLGIAAAAIVVLLILLQLVFGGAGTSAPTTNTNPPTSAGKQASAPAQPPFGPEDVVGMTVSHPSLPAPVVLEKTQGGWVAKDQSAPADDEAIDRLLQVLLRTDRTLSSAVSLEDAGLDGDNGTRITLAADRGRNYTLTVGLRPNGIHDATYISDMPGVVTLIAGDARAELGLWKNLPDAAPEVASLLEKRVFRFEPGDATKITATYPDHTISFTRMEDGTWRNDRSSPGGDWSRDGLKDWFADLATFQVSGMADARETDAARPVPTHRISISLAAGEEKTLQAVPNHMAEGSIVWVSDHPDLSFQLPEWRFEKYFNRLSSLFPRAVPNFDVDEIRVIDVRRGSDNVKIARQDDAWRTAALSYPLRQEKMDRLARLLAGWRPVDYADPDGKNLRAPYGGPVIEVVLANGGMHQYRLSGRHPLFPWRYVTLDGIQLLSVTDVEASAMFPGFADLLYLGAVFPTVEGTMLSGMRLEDADGKILTALARSPEGIWTATTDKGSLELSHEEGNQLAQELSAWPVVGFSSAETTQMTRMYHLEASWGDTETAITLFQPTERDIPYLTEGGHSFLLDRADFSNWTGTLKTIANRIEEQADKPAAKENANTETPDESPAHTEGDAVKTPEETEAPKPAATKETPPPPANTENPAAQPQNDESDKSPDDAATEADPSNSLVGDPEHPILDVSDNLTDTDPGSKKLPGRRDAYGNILVEPGDSDGAELNDPAAGPAPTDNLVNDPKDALIDTDDNLIDSDPGSKKVPERKDAYGNILVEPGDSDGASPNDPAAGPAPTDNLVNDPKDALLDTDDNVVDMDPGSRKVPEKGEIEEPGDDGASDSATSELDRANSLVDDPRGSLVDVTGDITDSDPGSEDASGPRRIAPGDVQYTGRVGNLTGSDNN